MEDKFIEFIRMIAHLSETLKTIADKLDSFYTEITDADFLECLKV